MCTLHSTLGHAIARHMCCYTVIAWPKSVRCLGPDLCSTGSPAIRGTLADAFRQATKSSLSLKLSSSTGSKLSRQLATTYVQHQQKVAAMDASAHVSRIPNEPALCLPLIKAPRKKMQYPIPFKHNTDLEKASANVSRSEVKERRAERKDGTPSEV